MADTKIKITEVQTASYPKIGASILITQEDNNEVETLYRLDSADFMPVTRTGTLNLAAASWTGSASPYTQTVSILNVVHSFTKIDLQPDATVLTALEADGVTALYIANNNGVLTAYALCGKPTSDLQIQCTLTDTFVPQ